MATIYTHAFAGVGLASVLTPRPKRLLYWVLAGFLPVLPDFDSFSTAAYGSITGHRGYTHSLAFALAVGLVAAGATYRYLHVRFWLLAALLFLVTASHGVLDAFTNGGFGIPFLWPFTEYRWGPYGPINVSDIAFELPDPRTSRAVRTELLYVWLPLGIAVILTEGCRWLRRRSATSRITDTRPG
jgi:inner membrane protein